MPLLYPVYVQNYYPSSLPYEQKILCPSSLLRRIGSGMKLPDWRQAEDQSVESAIKISIFSFFKNN
jgi:hypothetical protein